jgi:hypothetical protein
MGLYKLRHINEATMQTAGLFGGGKQGLEGVTEGLLLQGCSNLRNSPQRLEAAGNG